ncbi:MAG: carboxypeptidase-like regulatory domain-containing protein, partial [Candidatus Kapaibacterium sp.]
MAPVVSKTTIRGIVRNDSGAGIPSALVNTRPPSASVMTGSTGAYIIEDIPEGVYTVRASRAGYVSDSVSVSVVETKTTNADIVLRSVPPNAAPVSPFNPRPTQDSMVDLSEPLVFTWMC